jgi:tetratricopeptide (TPR) repeat protein
MIEPDRVLRPLHEARPAVEGLETYESPAALLEALRATWHAVDRALRTLLRTDPGAPDPLRLSALSDGLSLDEVLTALRRRDLLTMALAGRIHEFAQSLRRAEQDGVRAADADNALAVVHALEAEVHALGRAAARPAPQTTAAAVALADDPGEAAFGEDGPGWSGGVWRGLGLAWRRTPRSVLLVVTGVMLLAAAVALVLLLGGDNEMERGVEAFREGRSGVAEQHFRSVLERDPDNVNARLYLGRILRSQDRIQESADLLRAAVRLAPRDPAVRRELGYLLLALDRAPAAAEQFRMAVELDPDEPLGWVGVVEAMRRAGDPAAEDWLRRAPAEAQAMVRTGRP